MSEWKSFFAWVSGTPGYQGIMGMLIKGNKVNMSVKQQRTGGIILCTKCVQRISLDPGSTKSHLPGKTAVLY